MRDLRQIPSSFRSQVSGEAEASASPEYLALVALFGGDKDQADAWINDWVSYGSSSVKLIQILLSVQSSGNPDQFLMARPLKISIYQEGAGTAAGFDWVSIKTSNLPIDPPRFSVLYP